MDNNENVTPAAPEEASAGQGEPAAKPKGKRKKAADGKTAPKKQKKAKKDKQTGTEVPTVSLETSLGSAVPTVGLFLRALTAGVTAFGLVTLLHEVIVGETSDRAYLLFTALLFSALTALTVLGKKRAILGWSLIGVFAVLPLFGGDGFLEGLARFPNALGSYWNMLNGKLEKFGFAPLFGFYGNGVPDGTLTRRALWWIAGAAAVLMTLSAARRVRLLPVALITAAFYALPFTYNLVDDAFGFAVSLAGLGALLITWISERGRGQKKKSAVRRRKVKLTKEEKEREKKEKKALARAAASDRSAFPGGFTAAICLILCLAIVLPLYGSFNEPWEDIPSISRRMEYARAVMTAILTGTPINWEDPTHRSYDPKGEREARATKQKFKDEDLYRVYASYEAPVYLRTWLGMTYEEGEWKGISPAAAAELDYYVPSGAGEGAYVSGDELTSRLMDLFLPNMLYTSQTKAYGYYRTNVWVERLSDSYTRELPLPVRTDLSKGLVLSAYPEREDALPAEITHFYDGIYLSSLEQTDRAYAVTAFLPAYDDERFVNSFTALQKEIAHLNELAGTDAVTDENDRFPGKGELKYLTGSKAEREEIELLLDAVERYDAYVLPRYTAKSGIRSVRSAAGTLAFRVLEELRSRPANPGSALVTTAELAADGTNFDLIHSLVLAVSDYLEETCEYTLAPEPYHGDLTDPVDIFLNGNKEGYCVQFATAACMLLREMGIPTRYVEGYTAGTLHKTQQRKAGVGSYTGLIRDVNAHAWIEVYVPGFGWLDYEVTPGFKEAMFGTPGGEGGETDPSDTDEGEGPGTDPGESETLPPDETQSPDETRPPRETDEQTRDGETRSPRETEPETDENGDPVVDEPFDPAVLIVLAVIAGVLAAIVACWFLIHRFREKRLIERELLASCISESMYGTPGELDRIRFGHMLNDRIDTVCRITGLEREKNEQAVDYAARIDAALAETEDAPVFPHSFTEILPLMEKAEFGAPLNGEELGTLAGFYQALSEETQKRFGPLEKLWYVKIRQLL